MILLPSMAALFLPQDRSGFLCSVGVFLAFLVLSAVGCVFLLRRRPGGHYIVRLVVLVVFFSAR